MKTHDDLFELIKSLSRSEKRYFKVYASQHVVGEQNNYMKLFVVMDGLKAYSSEKLKKALKDPKLVRNLSYEKNYLYKMILKSLRAYRSQKRVDHRLAEGLQDAAFMAEKGLYAQARKLLKKITRLAEKHQKFYILLQIYDQERSVLKKSQLRGMQQKLEETNAKWKATEAKLRRHQQLAELYDEVFALMRRSNKLFKTEKIARMTEIYEKLVGEGLPDTFWATQFYHWVLGAFHQLEGNIQEVYNIHRKIISEWESHQEIRNENPQPFKKALSNYLSTCQMVADFSEFIPILDRIESIPCASFDEEAEQFQNVALFRLIHLINQPRITAGPELIAQIESGLDKYSAKINQARKLSLLVNVALLYFLAGDYKQSLPWLNRIIHDEPSEHRVDIQNVAHILFLLVHFELGNHDLLEYQLRVVRRKIRKERELSEFEKRLFWFLGQYGGLTDQAAREDAFAQLKRGLEEAKDPKGLRLGEREVLYWVNSV